jgi:hypothetical protein
MAMGGEPEQGYIGCEAFRDRSGTNDGQGEGDACIGLQRLRLLVGHGDVEALGQNGRRGRPHGG